MRYQETWENGPTGRKFQRSCEDRYQEIRKLASWFKRPFSVFDFGCNSGYFGFRLTQEFPNCTVVMVDNKPWLKDLIKKNPSNEIVWIDAHLTSTQLYHLAMCESFDIVLALAVIHHMEDPFLALNALELMADHIIIETPGKGDKGSRNYESHCLPLLEFLDKYVEMTKIAEFPSHVSAVKRPWYYKRNLPFIKKQRMDVDMSGASMTGTYDIESDFDKKIITIYRKLDDLANFRKVRTREMRHYIPGINLHNFKLLGGGWPIRGTELPVIGDMSKCDDNQPWNFILSGEALHAIDLGTKQECTMPRESILSYPADPWNKPDYFNIEDVKQQKAQ